MWDCLPSSNPRPSGPPRLGLVTAAACVLLAVVCGGCSTHILVAVDPDPDPCADGGCSPPGIFDLLIGYWRFEDGAGSKTTLDSSGNGNTGTLDKLDPST